MPQNLTSAIIASASSNHAQMYTKVLTVDSFGTLNAVLRVTSRLSKKARIHIKINSGMSRLGFNENDLDKLINQSLLR